MRKGVNPEKGKGEKNTPFMHRVIVPVYIPNLDQEYYKEVFEVFKICLNSLINTINFETSCITLINNDSIPEVDVYIKKLLNEGKIDKSVSYTQNRGKVYGVLSEAKAAFEPFVTIADADVLFFEGWERAVSEVFDKIPKAGVVSPAPSPHMALYHNSSVFSDLYLRRKIGYNKRVSDVDCELFLKGMGNLSLFNRNKQEFSWKQKQYFLKDHPNVILGAGHFVATYRSSIFQKCHPFPERKFENGYEERFIDCLADEMGLYRLSLAKTYAYHLGNKLDDTINQVNISSSEKLSRKGFAEIKEPIKSFNPYFLRSIIFKSLKWIKKL